MTHKADSNSSLLDEVERKLVADHPTANLKKQVQTGNAADELANTGDYDLLVIGNRGLSGIARVLGSTASSVTHNATTNLLLVNTTRT